MWEPLRAVLWRDSGKFWQWHCGGGKIGQFSLDMLVRLASRAGLKPKVKLAA